MTAIIDAEVMAWMKSEFQSARELGEAHQGGYAVYFVLLSQNSRLDHNMYCFLE